jgi:hypothetical protein
VIILLPISTEVFIFCQLLGWTHASWWWMAFFLANDASTFYGWRKSK